MYAMQGGNDKQPTAARKPPWLAPLVVLVFIVALAAIGSRKREAVENPVVDLLVITVGVFAFAAVFRVIGTKMGAPGMATFFGAPVQPRQAA